MTSTKIEWTEATWNPTIGCTKVTAGCKNCYAEIMARRLQAIGVKGYENGFTFTVLPDRFLQPITIKKSTKFFVFSMSDLFHEKMLFDDIDKIFETIKKTPQHYYQILTKREQKLRRYFEKRAVPANVWLGVTVENENVKNRINVLKTIDASIRFLSIEPLLGDVGKLDLSGIHWVIVGGESGPNARPMNPDWPKNIQKQCKEQNVAFFFKQWGTWGEDGKKRSKYANGSLLLGKEWKEEPNFVKHPETINYV
jgi:protein gp37